MSEVVFRFLLQGLADRALGAGEFIDVAAIAARVKVPAGIVRDAVARLEVLGLVWVAVDGSAGLVSFTPAQAVSEARAWAALHGVLIADVWTKVLEHLFALVGIRDKHAGHVLAGRDDHAGLAVFEFFVHLRALTTSPSIFLGADSSAYRLVLASPLLPHTTDLASSTALLTAVIDSIEAGDLVAAQHALTRWATPTHQ